MAKEKPQRPGLSLAWALSPLVTVGMGTPLTFGYAAARLRSWTLWLATGLYLIAWITMFVTADSSEGTAEDVAFVIACAIGSVGATVHAFAIKDRVFLEPDRRSLAFRRAQKEIEQRRKLRTEAAEIARNDPAMAIEMRIGRPDLPRSYDDGGLVDVNHAPASALVTVLGITPEQAEQLIRAREQCGGFVSAEEAAALADLPPNLTSRLAEYGVFLP
ncbi:ComEA family DNA-binding protein [Thermomonospora catenispora]|mgnify:CR=1 FL=1|uniref:ComEA family DNA-binding protein n=1 Tax=Thermomonospora catenispora TaxID=2493090 RepID=UPI001123EDB8|nr:helix-hairpin-helix domain-containing protein [Thermomonospora catenispora]TNY37800.1 helix-hairpin-helix domain-containing protein [Thermomonospora catenispora]